MAKSDKNLLEREVNNLISRKIESRRLLVLQELRLHPCEMDIVILDRETLRLANLEIKRSNWRDLLRQTIRSKLYCHFSVAIMPISMRYFTSIREFCEHGVGVVFYEKSNKSFNFDVAAAPKVSNEINRHLKQQLYREFYLRYGEKVYAS